VTRCRGAEVAEFLLDTEAASRLMRAERQAITGLRRSGAKSISVSSITMAELLYGARLRDSPSVMAAVRAFLMRVSVHPWDEAAAEAHARIRASAKRLGRSAGAFDLMIAAHAEALRAVLVTRDAAIKKLKIEGLRIVSW